MPFFSIKHDKIKLSMALSTFVKINSVNNLSDARYCAGMGVDLIGFKASEVSIEKFNEISGWLSGVDFVLEQGTSGSILDYNVNYIETSDASKIGAIDSQKVILTTNINEIPEDISGIEFLLVQGPDKLEQEHVTKLQSIAENVKIILAFGFNADNVVSIIEETGVHGIAITAGNEIRPGYKDYDDLADILEALEVDEWA